jgi:hypothetical protein
LKLHPNCCELPDEGIENHKEALSKFDEVQEKSNSIVETPVRPKTSKVTVTHVTNAISSPSSLSYNLGNSQQLGCNFKMNSIKLDNFTNFDNASL